MDFAGGGVLPRSRQIEKEPDMEQMQVIKSDIPAGMTLRDYRRLVRRPRRHSAIRRFASFGLLR
jgi:hypothetical protein